jgi:hypothetical protein
MELHLLLFIALLVRSAFSDQINDDEHPLRATRLVHDAASSHDDIIKNNEHPLRPTKRGMHSVSSSSEETSMATSAGTFQSSSLDRSHSMKHGHRVRPVSPMMANGGGYHSSRSRRSRSRRSHSRGSPPRSWQQHSKMEGSHTCEETKRGMRSVSSSSEETPSLDTSARTSESSSLDSHSMKHGHRVRPVSPMMANGGGYHYSRSRRSRHSHSGGSPLRSWHTFKKEGSHSGEKGGQ